MAVGFNGSGDYAKRTGSPAFSMTGNTDKFTLAGWMKIRDITPGAFSFPFGVEDADSECSNWALLGYTDTNVWCFATTAGTDVFEALPSQDTWYYVYITGENNGSGSIDFKGGY